MIISLIVILFKILAGLLSICLAIVAFHHFRAQGQVQRLVKQGLYSYPGNGTFLIGSAKRLQVYTQRIKAEPDKVHPSPRIFFLDEIEGVEGRFDAQKYPLIVFNRMSDVFCINSDPEVTADMFNSKSKLIEKTTENAQVFKDLLGSSLLFGPTDEDWRQKRKACAHAFYKERLQHMLEVLKSMINERVTEWNGQIAASLENSCTTINIAKEFSDIYGYNILFIAFGEDLSEVKFEIDFMTDKETGAFEKRNVNIVDAMNNIFNQVHMKLIQNFRRPVSLFTYCLFGFFVENQSTGTIIKQNCVKLRQFILDYVTKRKQGQRKSQLKNVDMLSLFLESPDIFTDNFIVDELMDFFFAGTLTTQYASQTMLSHFIHSDSSLEQAREEFKRVAKEQHPDLVSDSMPPTKEYLDQTVTLEVTQDLEHMNRVMCEALRYESPVSTSSMYYLKEDAKLGKYQFRKGDKIMNCMIGLHRHRGEWQRPFEFLPERFDSSNELSLAPNGRKRNPACFIPFNGGLRICLGKTFAEANLKIFLTYLTQSYDFKHLDPKYQAGQFPYSHFLQSRPKPVYVQLTKRK